MATIALVLLGALAIGVFLTLYEHSKRLLAFLVGVTASFATFQVSGLHVFTIVVLLFALFSGVTRRGVLVRCALIGSSSALLASTAWLGALATTHNSAVQLIVLTSTTVILLLRSDAESIRLARLGLLTITSIGSVVAVLQMAGVVSNEIFALEGNTESHRPAGIYPEPDWLGLYSALGAALAAGTHELRQGRRLGLVVLNLSGIAAASARAAVFAIAVGAVWAGVRALVAKRRAESPRTRIVPVLVVAVLGMVGAMVVFPDQTDLLTRRMQDAIEGNGSVVRSRWAQVDALQALADAAPWYGNGLSASGRVNGYGEIVYGDLSGGGSNGTNWLVGFWGDGKVLALPLIAGLVGAAFLGNRAGSTLLFIVLADSLFSNALGFPITWFALALALAPPAGGGGEASVRSSIPADRVRPTRDDRWSTRRRTGDRSWSRPTGVRSAGRHTLGER